MVVFNKFIIIDVLCIGILYYNCEINECFMKLIFEIKLVN